MVGYNGQTANLSVRRRLSKMSTEHQLNCVDTTWGRRQPANMWQDAGVEHQLITIIY